MLRCATSATMVRSRVSRSIFAGLRSVEVADLAVLLMAALTILRGPITTITATAAAHSKG